VRQSIDVLLPGAHNLMGKAEIRQKGSLKEKIVDDSHA
jgi:hypothetical protein